MLFEVEFSSANCWRASIEAESLQEAESIAKSMVMDYFGNPYEMGSEVRDALVEYSELDSEDRTYISILSDHGLEKEDLTKLSRLETEVIDYANNASNHAFSSFMTYETACKFLDDEAFGYPEDIRDVIKQVDELKGSPVQYVGWDLDDITQITRILSLEEAGLLEKINRLETELNYAVDFGDYHQGCPAEVDLQKAKQDLDQLRALMSTHSVQYSDEAIRKVCEKAGVSGIDEMFVSAQGALEGKVDVDRIEPVKDCARE